MRAVPHVAGIEEFLLAQVEGDDLEALRAEVERHRDRTMTVVRRERVETITRCRTCPKEQTRPCAALRALAMPYAQRPGYRAEWSIAGAESQDVGGDAVEDVPQVGPVVVLPLQRSADLPPPGNARRRILRQYGIGFQPSDFTDDELARRGITSGRGADVPPD